MEFRNLRSVFLLEINLISGRFSTHLWRRQMNRYVREFVGLLRAEASGYYRTICSRKSGPAICITLCVLAIVSSILPYLL